MLMLMLVLMLVLILLVILINIIIVSTKKVTFLACVFCNQFNIKIIQYGFILL